MAYAYRKQGTVDHTKVDTTDQSNYQMWVHITSDSDLAAHVTNANGYDLKFMNSTRTVDLPFQLISYNNANGELRAFVLLDVSASVDTTFWILYGDNGITTPQDNPTAVWGSNAEVVLHCEDNAGNTSVADSTSNGYTFTSAANTSGLTVAGKIRNAFTYNGSSDYLKRAYNADLNPSQFTVRAWVYSTGGGGSFRAIASSRDGSNASQTKGWILYHHPDGFVAGWTGINGAGWDNVNGSTTLSTSTWYLIHFTYNGTNSAIYVNGTSEANAAKSYTPNATYETRIGAGENENATPSFWFPGRIDETWIWSTALSANRIKTEYNNQNSPATFHSFGSEESNITTVAFNETAISTTVLTLTPQITDTHQASTTETLSQQSSIVVVESATSVSAPTLTPQIVDAHQASTVETLTTLASLGIVDVAAVTEALLLATSITVIDVATSTTVIDFTPPTVAPPDVIAYGRGGSATGYGRSGSGTGQGGAP